jgi:subtilisin family serine protease
VPGVIAVRSAELADDGPGVCAPGRDVLTLRPQGGYDFDNGSSLAAAQVSGIVALLRARNPKLDARGALRLLEHNHPTQGAGCLVNACAALSSMIEGMSCSPDSPRPLGLARHQK